MNKVMGNCSANLSGQEEELIQNAFEPLVELMKTNGELADKDFDAYNIPNRLLDETQSHKDNLVVYRRRSIILTNKTFVEKELMKKQHCQREVGKINQAKSCCAR